MIYEEQANECVERGTFYVLNYNINIKDISKENIKDRAEEIIMNRPGRTMLHPSPTRHEYIYEIVVNGSGLYEAQRINDNIINLRKEIKEENDNTIGNENKIEKFKDFVIARFFTVLIETIILFLIAKLCRKSWTIKNRKIIVT